jgi:dTDP-4-amino-4,6-dideoxygalactose transaminase
MPAYTFVATASAAEQCGYRVHLGDIDGDSLCLEPGRAICDPHLADVGLVIVVAPFGRPVPQRPWQLFTRDTGIPVVIDGAACVDVVINDPSSFIGEIPLALSFHATKSFATAEGGLVASTSVPLIRKVTQTLNFGFEDTREAKTPSVNGKLSEYHAAVGLAELDAWNGKLRRLRAVIAAYRVALHDRGLGDRLVSSPEISSSYLLFRCINADEALQITAALTRAGVGWRHWYGLGVQNHSYFAGTSCDDLPVTRAVAPLLIGLPIAVDLSDTDVDRVVSALVGAVAEQST